MSLTFTRAQIHGNVVAGFTYSAFGNGVVVLGTNNGGAVWSDDGGYNFYPCNIDVGWWDPDYSNLGVEQVCFMHGRFFAFTGGRHILRSDDGKTFTVALETDDRLLGIREQKHCDSPIFIVGEDNTYTSEDAGFTWDTRSKGYSSSAEERSFVVGHFVSDGDSQPYEMRAVNFTSTLGQHVFTVQSARCGSEATYIGNHHHTNPDYGMVYDVLRDPKYPDRILMADSGWHSNYSGASYTLIDQPPSPGKGIDPDSYSLLSEVVDQFDWYCSVRCFHDLGGEVLAGGAAAADLSSPRFTYCPSIVSLDGSQQYLFTELMTGYSWQDEYAVRTTIQTQDTLVIAGGYFGHHYDDDNAPPFVYVAQYSSGPPGVENFWVDQRNVTELA